MTTVRPTAPPDELVSADPPLVGEDGEEHAWKQFDLVLRPSKSWIRLDLAAVWAYRELLYFLVWRDIKVRYKQTLLGAAWAIVQPLFTMVIFSVFFGRLGGLASRIPDGVPYPLFVFAALVPWVFFATGLSQSSESLVGSSHVIKKVYFPRLIVPTAAVLTGLVDFAIALVLLFVMMLWFHRSPTGAVILLPLFILLALMTALGAGLWLSAINVQFRDVRHTMGFLIQVWLFATPIAYPAALLPEPWRTVYGINPMVGVVEGFRWGLLGTPAPGPVVWVSAVVSIVMLVTGAYYFRRMERTFADRV
jgi:lipopolysaccharide transport system permease protein